MAARSPRRRASGSSARPHPCQKIKACRRLSKSSEVMLDPESAVVAGAFAFHVACDEVHEALRTIYINPAALPLGAAKKGPNFVGFDPVFVVILDGHRLRCIATADATCRTPDPALRLAVLQLTMSLQRVGEGIPGGAAAATFRPGDFMPCQPSARLFPNCSGNS